MKQKKYKRGRVIRTFAHLSKLLDAGEYVFIGYKPQHHGWMISMSYVTLRSFLARKQLRVAVKNPKHNANAQAGAAVERHDPHTPDRPEELGVARLRLLLRRD